jgi:hypothetical protein
MDDQPETRQRPSEHRTGVDGPHSTMDQKVCALHVP